LIGVKNHEVLNDVLLVINKGVEKTDQNIFTLLGAKDFLEGKISFRVNSDLAPVSTR